MAAPAPPIDQSEAQVQTGMVLHRTASGALVSPGLSAARRADAARPLPARSVALTARESGTDLRVRLAIFRAIKEDMRQIITQMVQVHGDKVLRHKVTSTDLAHSAKLRCVFEGMDDMPADGLTPRQFTLALIERGYGRAGVLRMLPTEDDSTCSENSRAPLLARAEEPDLEERCASLVGTQVTLPEHGDCRVVSVCAGGHIKVVLQPSGRSTFVPMSAFGADATVNEPRSIDLSVMQPVKLPSSTMPARSIAQADIGEWFADQRSVTWEFQAGTLWSKFDEQTSEILEASINSCTPESSLGGSLMSLRAMRTANANALHLVNDLSNSMQVPIHDDDHLVEALPLGCRVVCADDEGQVVAAELSSVLAARGWCIEVCASASSPRKGDICLELESARDWPLHDARFGASAYALAIEKDAPLRIRARAPDGLRRGCAMLARSIGPGLHHQHAGVRMQRSICHGGVLAELVSPLAPSDLVQQAVPEQGGVSPEEASAAMPQLTARLPPCFYMDCPIHTGYNRIWYGRTDCWTLATFLDMAAVAGAFQPSHSRRVRRRMNYSRSDYKMLQVCSPVTGTNETYKYATAIESDGETVKVQLAGQPDTLEVPMNHLQVPATMPPTQLDWSTATFAQRSTSGKVGVLFLQFPDSRVVVAKLTDSPASELAGSELARMLGIRTPNIGVLSTAHGEGAKVVATLRRLRSEGHFEGKWEHPRKFAFVLLQELQSGRTLKELCHEEAAAMPSSTWALETYGPAGNPSERGMASLRALGVLVASDVLCHNSDRFFLPGLFQNFSRCGNVANLMFDSCGDNPQPIAIDNAFGAYERTRADNALRFQRYCDSVSELTSCVISRLRDIDNGRTPQLRAHPALKGVCEFFLSGQGNSGDASYVPGLEHDFGQLGLIELERGFLSVVERVQRWNSANGIENVFASLRSLIRQALGVPEQSVAFDLQRLEPSFFVAIANAMVTAQPAATSARNYSTLLPHDEAAETVMTTVPPEGWYIKRPALGVGKPFCKTGDRLAVQLETVATGTTTQWRIGVVRGYDQLSDRATVQFALPHGEKEAQGRDMCCSLAFGPGAGGDAVQLPQLISIGLDDLPSVRWALRTARDILHEEPEIDAPTADYTFATGVGEPQIGSDAGQQPSLPPPPVLTPPPAVRSHTVNSAVARVVDAGSCKDAVVPVRCDNEAYTSDRAMPWDRFARATARLEGNLTNAIAVSGRV